MMKLRNLSIYSLSSLAILASHVAVANQGVVVPQLDGGVTASIGTFYAVPSADNQGYALEVADSQTKTIEVLEANPEYDFGIEASLGYIFDNTANGIELSYRGFNTESSDSIDGAFFNGPHDLINHAKTELEYTQNALDLMISQFVNFGDHMQMRFSGGLAYIDFEQKQTLDAYIPGDAIQADPVRGELTYSYKNKASYNGLGPRIALDARYDFGQGLGVVGGGSYAYYLGDLDSEYSDTNEDERLNTKDNMDNHGVSNIRANLGVDYVYFFGNNKRSTAGIELGYQVDYYTNIVGEVTPAGSGTRRQEWMSTSDASFAGPYLQLKGTF